MSSPEKPTSIVLVDDHPIVRERLAEVLAREPGLVVCGEAESHRQALEVIAATGPDLAIIDLSLKNSHGLDLIKDLRSLYPHLLILVLSMHDGALHAERAIRAGAHGYITKQEATKKILLAIRKVLQGGMYLNETMSAQISSQMFGNRNRQFGGIDRLTDRELRVLELLGRGYAVRHIAEALDLNVKTVETYRSRIKEKLALDDATEVLQYAIKWIHTGGNT
jgi:DNA-binding NarL/FixJ family response regulator